MDRKEFAKVYNDIKNFPTIKNISIHFNKSTRTITRMANELRQNNVTLIDRSQRVRKDEPEKPFKVKRHLHNHDTPLSENVTKFHSDWTEDDCIKELVRVAKENPDKSISRNFFRVNSNISEATWNRYFGTWLEFTRQAGIILSRQQHQLEREIAKHASVDHYREFSEERKQWVGKYQRKDNKRYRIILVGSDLHDKQIDPFYLYCFLETAKRMQPDIIVLNGDIYDLPEFGKFNVDPREWDAAGRVKFVNEKILKPLRDACPDSQIDLIEGNHEFRFCRHICDTSNALRVFLSDLHGMDMEKLFCLDSLRINYVARGDLFAYSKKDINVELKRNYQVYFDMFLAHHDPEGKRYGMPGTNGHHHKIYMEPMYNEMFKSYNWVQTGCGHIRDANYCHADIWQNGFLVSHLDTLQKKVVMEPITLESHACIGGVYYYREDI